MVPCGGLSWQTGEARSQQGLEGWAALESEPEAFERASDGQMVNSGAEIHERFPWTGTRVFSNTCTMGSVWDSVQHLPCSGCLQHLGQLPTHGGPTTAYYLQKAEALRDSVFAMISPTTLTFTPLSSHKSPGKQRMFPI